jgi:hypothetical protein
LHKKSLYCNHVILASIEFVFGPYVVDSNEEGAFHVLREAVILFSKPGLQPPRIQLFGIKGGSSINSVPYKEFWYIVEPPSSQHNSHPEPIIFQIFFVPSTQITPYHCAAVDNGIYGGK